MSSGSVSRSWDVLDQSRAMYGVYDACGYSAQPLGLFPSEDAAEKYVWWLTEGAPEDERVNIDLVVCVTHVTGVVWNSFEPAPSEVPSIEDVERMWR